MRLPYFTVSTLIGGVLAVFYLGLLSIRAAPGELTVRWVVVEDPSKAYVEVRGLTDQAVASLRSSKRTLDEWQALLIAQVDHQDLQATLMAPPMLGTYKVVKNSLQFHPQFDLQRGLSYRATFDSEKIASSGSKRPISAHLEIPRKRTESTTVVTHIYPSSNTVPENLLKFYIHFSAPMSRGDIYDHIHLTNSGGAEVELPFLEIDEELWNRSMTRVTLFIDPGRIKRGVKPLEDIGPSLESGKHYTLTIDRAWQDADGLSLARTFEKKFQVSPPDREPPDPATWKVSLPKAGSRDALTIAFPEPMDAALATRLIRVANIDGTTTLGNEERQWAFTPKSPWTPGEHHVFVHNIIEDLAGNNVGKAFEVDIFEKIDDSRIRPRPLTLSFEVK